MTDELNLLVDKAASALKAAGAKEVYVFGSAAHGTLRENIDVDMAVSQSIAETKAEHEKRLEAKRRHP